MHRRPTASSPEALRRMRRQARRDTAPELALRRALHRRGMRYRVDVAPLGGVRRRADVVFPRARLAVYVHGCYWHGCPEHGTKPRANSAWWAEKLAANRRRDADTLARLSEAGWRYHVVWEHEDPETAADTIASLLRSELKTQD